MEEQQKDDRLKEIETLYLSAFQRYGTVALWSSRPVPNPTPGDALAITWSLRVNGDL
ncbi:MAG: hypothetical protein HQK97_11555 [Nitrospirae bacterium]|nr:hypothetical protein [Nitrospirota bacterium]